MSLFRTRAYVYAYRYAYPFFIYIRLDLGLFVTPSTFTILFTAVILSISFTIVLGWIWLR